PGPGRGAAFTVVLPARPAALAVGSAAPVAERWRLDGLNVLVVDDDEDARHIAEQTLSMAGAKVRTAASVEEARSAVNERIPDLLVSDIGMPGEDGYDLLGWIRGLGMGRDRALPAIALTAYA